MARTWDVTNIKVLSSGKPYWQLKTLSVPYTTSAGSYCSSSKGNRRECPPLLQLLQFTVQHLIWNCSWSSIAFQLLVCELEQLWYDTHIKKLVWQQYSLAESWSQHRTAAVDLAEYKSDPGHDISTGPASHEKEKFVLTELALEIPGMWNLGFPGSAEDWELFR